ncbi:hypothetical protein ABK040_006309 [Willaertia magna]
MSRFGVINFFRTLLRLKKEQIDALSQRKQIIGIILILILFFSSIELDTVLLPFTYLSTWFHEMAHAITALLLGFQVSSIQIDFDTSGQTNYYFLPKDEDVEGVDNNKWKEVLITLAGPFGIPITCCFFFLMSSGSKKLSLVGFLLLTTAMILSSVFWIRHSFTGLIIIPLEALLILMACWKWRNSNNLTVLMRIFALINCISLTSEWDYVLIDKIEEQENALTDVGIIQELTGINYKHVGLLYIITSILLVGGCIYLIYKWETKRRSTLLP